MERAEIAALKSDMAEEFARYERQERPAGFPALPDLPAGRYTDPDFFALEQKHIWSKSWLFAGHADEFSRPGAYKLWRDAGVPIVLVRGADGVVRGFYNTCRHRGGPLVREAAGEVASLMCKYHCWNYDLEGRLKFVPDEHEFAGLDKSERALIAVKVAQWGNLVFVNLDENAAPLNAFLGPLVPELADLGFARLKFVEKHAFNIASNWKVAMDAFQEVYHLKHIHPQTVDVLLDHRGVAMTLYPNGHSRMITPHRAPQDTPGADPAHEITRTTSRAYSLFPNVITPVSEFEFPLLVFWPTSIRTCRMDVIWFGQPDDCDAATPQWRDRIANFDAILEEDTENLSWIQESLETPGFKSVPLSYQERRIYNHHTQIDRVIGAHRLPEGLAIPDVLGPHLRTD